MHGSLLFPLFTIFFFFFLLSCAPPPLFCASPASLRRRLLYDAALPPPEVPSSTSTPGGSPFFPLYPAVPPPPPPATFATFPANISALVLPRSPKPQPGSRKLLIPAISAVLSIATVTGLAFFLYGRWRGQNGRFKERPKGSASDNDNSSSHELCQPQRNTANKLSVTVNTSEVLYLGNVVTSQSAEDQGDNRISESLSGFSKPESPEIRPLPPLPVFSFEQKYVAADSLTEEEGNEEEEFYSPPASLACTESSTRPGYGPGIVGQEHGPSNIPYSTCSCSSSSSGSPARSLSVTISPPMSSTVRQRDSDVSSEQNPRSPSLSVASPSPDRGATRSHNRSGSLRMFSFWNQNVGFPRISSASSSPDRGTIITPDACGRSSLYSSVSTSPDGVFRKFLECSPPKWNDFNRNVQSVLLCPNSASPRRDFVINLDKSSESLNPSGEIPDFCRSEPSEPAPPPCRPPPPPPREQPLSSQRVPEPPPLVPPSLPFVLQKPWKKHSFSELPPGTSEATEQKKTKLKPLHWDKVRASSCRRTSWDRLRSSSFKLNEGKIANPSGSNSKQRSWSCDAPILNQENRVLDPKGDQNIGILLRALNRTMSDVCQALVDGDCDALGVELLESLSRMAPSQEEELKLKEIDDNSLIRLGPTEKFLKDVLDVPLGFKRVDALIYVANFDSEVEYLKRSFDVIQAACEELQNSRMFLKLLEAVLETGNKMNDGTNHCDDHVCKLDILLKLVDVKGTDGRTTLLRYVLQEIIKSEGARLSDTVKFSDSSTNEKEEEARCRKLGLQLIQSLSSELADVKKSADMNYCVLESHVSKLSQGIDGIKEILQLSEGIGSTEGQWRKFRESMRRVLETAVEEIKKIETRESSALSAVKEITEYFHGDSAKEEAHPFRIFVVVRDFLAILDQVCKEIGESREYAIPCFSHSLHS
ncbi:PREDICTED: formin-like protein 10 [Tarenaya hassleriana]|uniref:formin-like protein 10 n=1 Tax=Tarenaya hassleriana TaxID=28532 RepID=UPI00053C130A|nr:PREDICTED: formin-like protein 10 [Tarenaya hassleriana]